MTSAQALPRISEHQEQADFIREVALRFGLRDDYRPLLLFAVPNGMQAGGENRFALINKFKAEGMRVGVADLFYLQPRGPYAYLAIEMKAQDQTAKKDGGVSPDQAAFLAEVNAAGATGEVCYGCEAAVTVFSWYMSLPMRSDE